MSESLCLSLILPAYNEAARLPPYLASIRPYLARRYGDRYEVLVVDDGSTDGLGTLLEHQAAGWAQLRSLRHPENQGKGAAVRTGVLAARAEIVLFADADGATPIDEECRLVAAIHAGADLAIGSRLLAAEGARRSRHWLRGLAGRVFAGLARRVLGLSVCDTQCGFKMFRADAARRLFSLAREPRYLFDLEILALAARLGYRCVEVPINWREVPGGHFRLGCEIPRVLRDLWRLRRRLHQSLLDTQDSGLLESRANGGAGASGSLSTTADSKGGQASHGTPTVHDTAADTNPTQQSRSLP